MSMLIKGLELPQDGALTLDIWKDGTVRVVSERIFKGQAVEVHECRHCSYWRDGHCTNDTRKE